MTSNAMSRRGQILHRPKVCKSIPKWKKIAGGSFPACSLEPSQATIDVDETLGMEFFACLLCEPKSNPIGVQVTATDGDFLIDAPHGNCTPSPASYKSSVPGEKYLQVLVTWFTGAKCYATAQITVVNP